jgi:hypothetical protein
MHASDISVLERPFEAQEDSDLAPDGVWVTISGAIKDVDRIEQSSTNRLFEVKGLEGGTIVSGFQIGTSSVSSAALFPDEDNPSALAPRDAAATSPILDFQYRRRLRPGSARWLRKRIQSGGAVRTPSSRADVLLRIAYVHVSEGRPREAFRRVALAMEQDMASGSTELVSDALRLLQPELAGVYLSVGMLRTAFCARRSVATWWSALQAVAAYLETQELDVRRTLSGLLAADDGR